MLGCVVFVAGSVTAAGAWYKHRVSGVKSAYEFSMSEIELQSVATR